MPGAPIQESKSGIDILIESPVTTANMAEKHVLEASNQVEDALPSKWEPNSWKNFPILQQPEYKDPEQLDASLSKLNSLPPLVDIKEIDKLQKQFKDASEGRCFVLQGGDCAERFLDCNADSISSKFKILLQMSLILIYRSTIPVVRVARIAGQFAKPRSSPVEKFEGKSIHSFKGDNVNGFSPNDRQPNPARLVEAYFHSAATLNFLRASISGGGADLHKPKKWDLPNNLAAHVKEQYDELLHQMMEGFAFLSCIGADQKDVFAAVDMFTAHEGLLLNYESSLTRPDGRGNFYNTGCHFLWIGDRTRSITGAHVEYFRGISNPIGVKVGPSMKNEELEELVKILNPNKIPGHLTLITRYGCDKVSQLLPGHIAAVKRTGIPVLWVCDPCHGNTRLTENKLKTRSFSSVLTELLVSFDVHLKNDSILGGMHLELTGENVTECTGGSTEKEDKQVADHYTSYCDPRLNYTQSLDIALAVSKKLTSLKVARRKESNKLI